MRIVHIDPEVGWRGGESQVLALMRELRRAGHTSLLAAPGAGELTRRAAADGFEVADVPCRFGHDPRAGWSLRRICLGQDPDVVHVHTARALTFVRAAPRHVARVLTRRMDTPPRGAGPYVRWLYRGLDEVIAISEAARRGLAARGVGGSGITLVPSGVDIEIFAPRPVAVARAELGLDDGFWLAIVGGLHARKGHAILLDALSRLDPTRRARVRLLVAGTGPEEGRLRERARGLGVAPAVRWLGEVAAVAAVLTAADLVLQPSLAEGLGVAVLEAMACGRAVVASAVGGLRETIRDGREGLLVPPGDADALARALAACMDAPERLGEFGAAGRTRALEFSTARMAARTLSVYERALARQAAGRDASR